MYKLNKYYGDNKPDWDPNHIDNSHRDYPHESCTPTTDLQFIRSYSNYPIYIIDNAFSEETCTRLIHEFELQPHYPVGVDGYNNSEEAAGSHRAMAWSSGFSTRVSSRLASILPSFRKKGFASDLIYDDNVIATPFAPEKSYNLLGSTPWLRFMKYKDGGKHVPHYDASYHNETERYITLFSWVLYLNTPIGQGGAFQFVREAQHDLHPSCWDRSDWSRMADDSEIVLSVAPKQGRLLVFPHWLCHQVQEYTGYGSRYICRGDTAYAY